MMLPILLVVGLLSAILPAYAEVRVSEYRNAMRYDRTKQRIEDYVTGVGSGAYLTNGIIKDRTGSALFCMPDDYIPGGSDFMAWLDEYIYVLKMPDDSFIEILLLTAMQRKFPCD